MSSSSTAAHDQQQQAAAVCVNPNDTPTARNSDPYLRHRPSSRSQTVRDGDFVLLHFGDGRQVFAPCPGRVRVNRKYYATHHWVGLPYGTVLEQQGNQWVPLADPTAKLIPDFVLASNNAGNDDGGGSNNTSDSNERQNQSTTATATNVKKRDNRSIVDNNTSQALGQSDLETMRQQGVAGADIVATIVEHSATFDQKTDFAQQKYVVRKQMKYQPRCRIVRCNAATIAEAMFAKDPRRVMNLRHDTLGQILSYANLSAGCQCLVLETCFGIVTGAVAQRLAGYGKIISLYTGQQHSFTDMLNRFNLSFGESANIKWVHTGDVFGRNMDNDNGNGSSTVEKEEEDFEQKERDVMSWPCPLQPHTRNYIERELGKDAKRREFLLKRQARFARKLCRQTPLEAVQGLRSRPCDSVIIVAKYDPTESILALLPYLAPSCPFVVYCENIEPLSKCFRQLQQQELAINMRLSDTWMREYQVLKDRTHPNMNMCQHGGFLLTGIKLDPVSGRNELDEEVIKEVKEQIVGKRRRERFANKKSNKTGEDSTSRGKHKKKKGSSS